MNQHTLPHSQIVMRSVDGLKPYANNARTHTRRQIRQIASSIEHFGFTNPVLISDDGEIIAGHGRVRAAELLGMKAVPTLALSHLSAEDRRAYVLADNKLALNAGWDQDILAIELQGLIDLDFDLELTGFELAEIDLALSSVTADDEDAANQVPEPEDGPAVTHAGDVWILGKHRLICGDARDGSVVRRLVGTHPVDLIFTDPPYNVAIDGNVCGSGSVKHRGLRSPPAKCHLRTSPHSLQPLLGMLQLWRRMAP